MKKILFILLVLSKILYAQYDLQVIAIHNSVRDSLYMKTEVNDTLWRKTNGVYNTAYVAKQWAYFPFFQPINPPTTLAGYGITDGLTTSAAASAYQPAGSYALASHTHSGVYQPVGSYLVAADITGKINKTDTAAMLANYVRSNGNITGTSGGLSANITESQVTNLVTDLAAKAPLANPAFTGTPTGIGIPVYAQVTGSNVTTTGQALTDITGLSVALTTNATYEFEAVMSCQTSAVTTGTAYGVQYSAAGAAVEAQITGSSTSTASKTLRISALNSATALYLATSAQTGGVVIKGRITTGANSGNLTIQHLKLTSGTSTIFIGSFLKVTHEYNKH